MSNTAPIGTKPPKGVASGKIDEEIDPSKYREARLNYISDLKANGKNPYPHKFDVTISIPKFIETYSHLKNEEVDESKELRVAGRVMRLAGSGASLRFYDLVADDEKIQIMADGSRHKSGQDCFLEVHNSVHRGDIVGVTGFPSRTKRGELSILPTDFLVLSHCLHMLPSVRYGLKDQEIRYRQRYMDLLINPKVKNTFVMRSRMINYLRKYLTDRDFVEVETPMMNIIPGGATARPFITHHNELDLDLYMRIAPELFLKELVVGGMDRVFEIGKNFRNEGIDLTHNPEFTACEFYMAYADYNDVRRMTEELVSGMVKEITGSYKLKYHPDGDDKEVEIDFTPPWPIVSFVGGIEKNGGVVLPRPFDSPECIKVMIDLCKREHLDVPKPATASKLLDKLCGHFIESRIVSPTFISDHPQLMSPLAKWHRTDKELSERCELFIMGKEIANFYTELNDPVVQRSCFESQAQDKAAGDDEAQFFDETFCTALEYALPPTGGWGLGLDRLVMFLTDNINIKEVILFPAMKPLPNTVPATNSGEKATPSA